MMNYCRAWRICRSARNRKSRQARKGTRKPPPANNEVITIRDYKLKRTGYELPYNVYKSIKYMILDYERMRSLRERILHESSAAVRDTAKAGNTGDPTGQKAVTLAGLSGYLAGIDKAAHDVALAYADAIKRTDIDSFDALGAFVDYGLFCCLLHDPDTGAEPCYKTWQRYKTMLAYHVAKNLLILG